jgi:thiol-disulfide isomerase/thioredoxin
MNSALFKLVVFLAVAATSTSAVQLTIDNFEQLTKGRAVFIKFFAPWCGHCRSMAEDWEKLEEDWKDHDVALVAEVDCTSDGGQPICDDFDVQVRAFVGTTCHEFSS